MRDPHEPTSRLARQLARMSFYMALVHAATVVLLCYLAGLVSFSPLLVTVASGLFLFLAWGQLKSIRHHVREWHWIVAMNREAGMPYISHIIVGVEATSVAVLTCGCAYLVGAAVGLI